MRQRRALRGGGRKAVTRPSLDGSRKAKRQREKAKQGRCSMRSVIVSVGAAALALWGSAASAQEFRIGFINTMSGVGATIGDHQVNGWKLGLEHERWSKDGDVLAGVATSIFYADDQAKTDIAVKEVDKLLTQHK